MIRKLIGLSGRIRYPLFAASLFVPLQLSAALHTQIDKLVSPTGGTVVQTLNLVIGLLFVLATIIFLWGVIQFITKAGDEVARSKAKGIMTWGIIGLAVMAASWGVVNILLGYFLSGVSGGTGGTKGFIPTKPGDLR